MKKLAAVLLATLLFIAAFVVTTSAHPGKTDSDGGHFDRSTGEYHFHDGSSAGQNNSSASSYHNYESIKLIKKEWERRGAIEGLKQLCIDTAYMSNFNSGFKKAVEDYSSSKPIFNLLYDVLEDEELFYIDFYDLRNSYEETRLENFSKYDCYIDYYKTESITDFNNGYDRAYEFASTRSAPEHFLLNDEIGETRKHAYSEGYRKFFDGNLYAYIEERPVKGFLISLEYYVFIASAVFLFILIILIFFIKKHTKHKYKTDIYHSVEKNTLDTKQPKPPIQETIQDVKQPPSNNAPLTVSKMMHELATENVKPYKMCRIGKDISAGTLYFAPADESIRSFFESGDEICHISQKNQRFFFTDCEIIYLYNCAVSTEEFK